MHEKRTHGVLQRTWVARKRETYYYIKYAISAVRVIAWVVLVLGFVGSLVWGVTAGGIGGGGRILIGVVASFLAWLLLLASSELLKLFMDVKENTENAAGGVSKRRG